MSSQRTLGTYGTVSSAPALEGDGAQGWSTLWEKGRAPTSLQYWTLILAETKDTEAIGGARISKGEGKQETWNSVEKSKYFQTFEDKIFYYLQFLMEQR